MAIKPLNSVAGFSVGQVPSNVILGNGDIFTNNITVNNFANLGNVGNVYIGGGSNGQVLQTDGAGNLTWSSSANVNQIHNGNSNVTIPNINGNVYINANSGTDQQWNFTTSGNLVLPLGGIITESSSPSGLGNTITLTPSGGSNANQQLVIYPTGVGDGDHIHLTSGNLSSTSIFLGNDTQYIRTRSDGSMVIGTDDGNPDTSGVGYRWIFDVTGNLTAPNVGTANLGNLVTANYANFYNDLYAGGNANIVGNLVVQGNIANANNISVTNDITSNTANIIGNLTSGNANLGNLVTVNYANITNDLVVQGNIANANNISVTNTITAGNANVTFDLNVNNNTYVQGTSTANFFYANYDANITGNLVVQGNIANANNISVSNNITTDTANVTANLTAGNVDGGNLVKANNFSTNGSGGDITLTGGNVQGANVTFSNSYVANFGTVDFTSTSNVALGDVANVHITGGSSGYLLSTDGTGNLTWSATASTNNIFNGNSNVSIPVTDGNVYINANAGTDQQWNFDTTGNLTAPSIGTANLGNLVVANYANFANDVVVQGNIANAGNISVTNAIAAGSANITNDLVVQGNIANAGNISVTNAIAAGSANITNDLVVQGNIANANNISVTNNITAGSANVTNDLDVGGNIVTGTGSGGNISGVNYLFANVANISNVVNTGAIANGTSNIRLAQDGNVTISSNNTSNVFTFSDLGANVIGYIQANGIISAGGFEGSNLVSNVGILSLQAKQTGGDYNINLLAGGAGNIDVGSTYITSVANPQNPQDAATKYYVDLVAQGLHVHAPANLATGDTLANILSIPSGNVVYYQPGPEGVGATLTFTGNSLTQLDGNTVTANMRLLIKNEANAIWNGVYTIGSNAFFITRATDEDNNADLAGGDFLFVESGTQFADTGWVQTTDNVVIGTSNIVFNQFSGAGQYTGANGISIVGTTITANVDNDTTAIVGGNIAVKAGANLVTPNIGAATGTSLDLTGNVVAGNLNSNAMITTVDLNATGNIVAANLTSNAFITAVDGNLTGNLTVGGNITTTGSTGNISGANVIFANSFTSNGGTVDFNTNNANVQLGSNANVHLYGGSTGQVLQTDGNGNLNWYSISATSIQNGNSNVTIPTSDGNIYINANSGTDRQWNFDTTGNLTAPAIGTANLGNLIVANNANISNSIALGNTAVNWGTLTTSTITANQTIATLSVTGVTGIEFLVKGVDAGGAKYSIATVQAVTDGANVDYSTFGGVQLGGYTGSLAVNIDGSNISLQVTPASSNSTVWTTQYRVI